MENKPPNDAVEAALWQALEGVPGVDLTLVVPEFLRLLSEAGYRVIPAVEQVSENAWLFGDIPPCKLCAQPIEAGQWITSGGVHHACATAGLRNRINGIDNQRINGSVYGHDTSRPTSSRNPSQRAPR